MRKKISTAIIKVSFISVLVGVVLVMAVIYSSFMGMLKNQQRINLALVCSGYAAGGDGFLSSLKDSDMRITHIAAGGEVLFDNRFDISKMDNHADRPEVIDALRDGKGFEERSSSTFSRRYIYTARRLPDGSVMRVSNEQNLVLTMLGSVVHPLLLVLVLSLIMSVLISGRVSRAIVAPINNIDLDHPLSDMTIYDEISPLLTRISKQNRNIKKHISDINKKIKEIDYITEGVADGIIILNEKGIVISANKKSGEILGAKKGDYYLDFYRDDDYYRAISSALEGNNISCNLRIDESDFLIYASTVKMTKKESAVFLFIRDVTGEVRAQEQRKNFTSNVSHELKTPLASIMGTAEIIQNGIVKPEDIKGFAGKIYTDAKRMLELVKDILRLSELDEGQVSGEKIKKDLAEICLKVRADLQDRASKKNVKFLTDLTTVHMMCIPAVIYEVIYNLCLNGIDYNIKGGQLTLSLRSSEDGIKITTENTGETIPPGDLPHIFERFYRIDKSHCKHTGGTGLGLSIVKHGAELHGGRVSAESGETTRFMVEFPENAG